MSQKYEYFGKYILLEKLAMGGMAEVWLARAPGASGIGRFVAIKKILPQYSDNAEFIQMFKDEAAIAMNLSHSNIVSIFEFGQEKNQLFLVMDYVEGRNLRQILNKMKQSSSKFAIDQIAYAIKEVAAGLDHAHRSLNSATGKPLNITHRDMSPQNIMITFEGEIRIVDFGIAKAESQMEQTKTGTLKGKFGYMSPEQAEGLPTDLRTDIFSLGICLWELVANERLFIANNEINTLKKIRECNVPSLIKINPNIHPELERIVMKALTRDRNLRYQTAAALHRDLSRYLNRQFPDFSPHDFSVFIKTLYTDEILDVRKRLIEYAKIPFRMNTAKGEDLDKTMVTSFPQASETKTKSIIKSKHETNATVTATETFTDSEAEVENKSADDNDQITDSFGDAKLDINPDTDSSDPNNQSISVASSISFGSKAKPKIDVLDHSALQNSFQNKISVSPKAPKALFDDDESSSLSIEQGSQRNHNLRPKADAVKKRNNAHSNSALNLMVFVGFTIISYVLASTYFPVQLNQAVNIAKRVFKIEQQSVAPPSVPTIHPVRSEPILDASAPSEFVQTTPLVVNSVPSGADIYLNGLATGKVTPARIDVPADSSFAITLKMSRFLNYSKNNLTIDKTGRTFTAVLQKSMVAYVDIDVKPPVNARVYVNGQALSDEILPINRYAIPAGTPVTIRAENPITGSATQEVITLREDQRYKVILQLDKNRLPSNRR
ncbi:MAG: serine/threonine protein kinase [Bdellovibrionales bacterium]|nr:serine/threonine protein kinase [Bdellovibrionales bacterium]